MRHSLLTGALAGVALLVNLTAAPAQQSWGTVKGQVVFAGDTIPPPVKEDVNKDQQHCLEKGPIMRDTWVINPKSQGVLGSVVWLVPEGGRGKLPVHPALQALKDKEAVMDQPCCMFVPRTLAMRQGQVLVAKNSSPIAHNFNYAGLSPSQGDNKSIPAGGYVKIPDLKKTSSAILVACNIHSWMRANIMVFDHPYFAVTDADGRFTIKDAPAGKYQLASWHEGTGWGPGGRTGTPVEIKADGEVEVKVKLIPTK